MPFDFGWSEFWGLCALGTLLHSHLPIRPMWARNHVFGAEIMLVQWVLTETARNWSGDLSPIGVNAGVDFLTGALFIFIALRKRAAWAAVCFLLHLAMLFLHLAFIATGQANEYGYIVFLNLLFGASLITINTAVWAGRDARLGTRLDALLLRFGWSWSFAGVGAGGDRRDRGKAA